ncbi:SDR family oxidoreductase [Salmonella sp. s29923]|uniref:SDR family oxidoreductase n=1 Tax=Salmonella sp. s29923 TaxID=3159635 RepID=UPI003981539C
MNNLQCSVASKTQIAHYALPKDNCHTPILTNSSPHIILLLAKVQNLTLALLPLLREGTLKTVLNMGSIVGSITYAKRFMVAPDPAYRVSKAALHCLTRLYALELEAEGFTFVAVSPGVSTGLDCSDQSPHTPHLHAQRNYCTATDLFIVGSN